MYSMYNGNIIHYIDTDVEGEEELLAGMLPITMKFVTDTKERCERLLKTYRRIHDAEDSNCIAEDIGRYLDETEWRM